MRTITEFATIALKNALAKKQELTTAGKTAEELPAAMGEALKIEGDKLTHLMGALEAINDNIAGDLKRVIVSSLNEGEKAPSSAKQIGEKYYTVEHYPPIQKKGAQAEGGREGRGGRRDGKGGRDGKRGDRGGRGGDRDRGPGGGGGREAGAGGGGRGPRGPKPAGAGPLPLPKPLTKPSAGAKPEAASEAPAAEKSGENPA
jgi:hypothetical protein